MKNQDIGKHTAKRQSDAMKRLQIRAVLGGGSFSFLTRAQFEAKYKIKTKGQQ